MFAPVGSTILLHLCLSTTILSLLLYCAYSNAVSTSIQRHSIWGGYTVGDSRHRVAFHAHAKLADRKLN